jgi:hypothetical protein
MGGNAVMRPVASQPTLRVNEDEVVQPPPNVVMRPVASQPTLRVNEDEDEVVQPPPPNVVSLLRADANEASRSTLRVVHTHSSNCRHILDSGGLFLPPSDQKLYDKAMTIYHSAESIYISALERGAVQPIEAYNEMVEDLRQSLSDDELVDYIAQQIQQEEAIGKIIIIVVTENAPNIFIHHYSSYLSLSPFRAHRQYLYSVSR